MVTELPPADDATPPTSFAGPDHPIRETTRQIAFEDGWSPGRAAKVAELFDSMASDWHDSHRDPLRVSPVRDALERGNLNNDGTWLELGAGTGAGTEVIKPYVDTLIAIDLASGMLNNGANVATAKVQADSSALPVVDHSADVIVCVNMFLFPKEVDRVLKPEGQLLWVNTMGDQTPIHLPAVDVAKALPGEWAGVTANAGTGFWAVYQRS
jgi:SAM-dependent methyltransferase